MQQAYEDIKDENWQRIYEERIDDNSTDYDPHYMEAMPFARFMFALVTNNLSLMVRLEFC